MAREHLSIDSNDGQKRMCVGAPHLFTITAIALISWKVQLAHIYPHLSM